MDIDIAARSIEHIASEYAVTLGLPGGTSARIATSLEPTEAGHTASHRSTKVVDAVAGKEAWRRDFTERYLTCDQIPERMAQATLLSAHIHRS